MQTLLAIPTHFLDSWQYRKITDLHGKRLANACALTLWQMYSHVEEHGSLSPIEEKAAMAMAKAYGRRDKRRILEAMRQANLLRCTPDGYRILALATVPTAPSKVVLKPLSAPAEQLALPLRPTSRRPKTQQKQPTSLARAGDMSAPASEKPPLIEDASTHTYFLSPTFSERSETEATARLRGCLFGERSDAAYRAAQAGASLVFEKIFQKRRSDVRSSLRLVPSPPMLKPARSVPKKAGQTVDRSAVDRVQKPHTPPHRATKSAQRVTLDTRKHTSAVTAGRMEPSMSLTAAQVQLAVKRSGIWPGNELHQKQAESIVAESFTLEDIDQALSYLKKRSESDNPPRLPSLLHSQLREQRSRKAEEKERKPVASAHPQRRNAEQCETRMATRDAINAVLGPKLHVHHCASGPWLDALAGHSADAVVSLYSEMMGVRADDRWEEVGQAWANGARPRRMGQRPPANDEQFIQRLIRSVTEGVGMDVQSNKVDKLAHAG